MSAATSADRSLSARPRGGRRRRPLALISDPRLAALYVLICLIWGTTWLGIKYGVETVPPLTAAGLRFLLAFPFLALVVRRWPGARLRYPPGHRALFVFVTAVYLIVPYALLNVGEEKISSGLAAILFSTVSVYLVIFARVLIGTRVRPRQWIGVVLGIALLGLVVTTGREALAAESVIAPLAVLAAAMLHGLSYVVIKKHGSEIHPLTLEAAPIGVAGVALTLFGVIVEHPAFGAVSLRSAAGIAYLALIPSVVGFAVYFYLLQRIQPILLSFVFILFPVVALLVSAAAESKGVPLSSMLLVVAMLGAFALTKSSDEPAESEAAAQP
jgi:drug/metabolite transporter (DMT)-like permease